MSGVVVLVWFPLFPIWCMVCSVGVAAFWFLTVFMLFHTWT